WADNSTDEPGFVLQRSINGGAWQNLATLSANVTSFVDNSVLTQTTYAYRVRATGVLGDSAYSNPGTCTTPAAQSVTYLSDLPFAGTATNGWGPIELDQSVGGINADDGGTLTLNGITYTKGLGTNAVSDVSFTLGGAYKSFLSDVGVDDHQLYDGSVDFQVFADNTLIFDSGVMTPDSATKHVNVAVTG